MTVWSSVHDTRAVAGIRAQIASGDPAHAWLLVGPAGAGKLATAVAMAAALNCREEPGVGCGRCSTCLRTMRRRHPDVHHVAAEGTFILVDTIRDHVIAEAARSPFEAEHKVFIIEEAERMNPAAQNALLKTLEEPEGGSVFILVSSRDEEVLDTIKSRSRIVALERMTEQSLADHLRTEGAADAIALLAARLAEGDLHRARALGLNAAVMERRRVWLSIPRRLTGAVDALDLTGDISLEVKQALAALAERQKEEIADLADALGEGRGTASARTALTRRHKREARRLEEEVMSEALTTLASFYRDVLALRRGAPEAVVNIDVLDELHPWAAADVADAELVRAIERCVEARGALARNANQTLALESALVDLARLVPPDARVGTS